MLDTSQRGSTCPMLQKSTGKQQQTKEIEQGKEGEAD
jgi:hypothetical protein